MIRLLAISSFLLDYLFLLDIVGKVVGSVLIWIIAWIAVWRSGIRSMWNTTRSCVWWSHCIITGRLYHWASAITIVWKNICLNKLWVLNKNLSYNINSWPISSWIKNLPSWWIAVAAWCNLFWCSTWRSCCGWESHIVFVKCPAAAQGRIKHSFSVNIL